MRDLLLTGGIIATFRAGTDIGSRAGNHLASGGTSCAVKCMCGVVCCDCAKRLS